MLLMLKSNITFSFRIRNKKGSTIKTVTLKKAPSITNVTKEDWDDVLAQYPTFIKRMQDKGIIQVAKSAEDKTAQKIKDEVSQETLDKQTKNLKEVKKI